MHKIGYVSAIQKRLNGLRYFWPLNDKRAEVIPHGGDRALMQMLEAAFDAINKDNSWIQNDT
jgi:hypothetical protein